jgi:hypothetical protein
MRQKNLIVAALACTAAWPAWAQEVDSPLVALTPGEGLRNGEPILVLRPRYTWVDQSGQQQKTYWGSLRTQLGWETLEYHGFKLTAEMIDTRRFGSQNTIDYRNSPAWTGAVYDPLTGTNTSLYGNYGPGYYPLVADPQETDINRLHLDYVGLPATKVRAGRQVVRIDNQRFLGDYDFAQMPQLLDGVSVSSQALPRTQVTYGYFYRLRNAYAAEWKTSTNAASAQFDLVPGKLKIGGYGFFQNQARTGSVTGFDDNSNRILGARAWGMFGLPANVDLLYVAEAAQQRDFAGGDPRIRADYYRLGGGLAIRQGFVRVDWERLGSNDGQYGFQTPLGSTQMFTGRVDIFATTPPQGLEDLRASVGAQIWKVAARLDYHRFHSDHNNWDLGHEWDLALDYAITSRFSAGLVYGDYRAGGAQYGFTDTRKFWLTVAFVY